MILDLVQFFFSGTVFFFKLFHLDAVLHSDISRARLFYIRFLTLSEIIMMVVIRSLWLILPKNTDRDCQRVSHAT